MISCEVPETKQSLISSRPKHVSLEVMLNNSHHIQCRQMPYPSTSNESTMALRGFPSQALPRMGIGTKSSHAGTRTPVS